MNSTVLLITPQTVEINTSTGYVIGSVIAFLILVYLLYTLLKPEKF